MQAGSLSVEACRRREESRARCGHLVDNAIDPTTGTVRLKASFPNLERRLWPGQFANVTLTLAVDPRAARGAVTGRADRGHRDRTSSWSKPDSTVENRRVVGGAHPGQRLP